MAALETPVEALVGNLFAELGIQRAHVGACMLRDVAALIGTRPETIASLVFLGARALDPDRLAGLGNRLLFIRGDHGPNARAVPSVLPRLTGAVECVLEGYEDIAWGNAAQSHGEVIAAAMEAHLTRARATAGATALNLPDSTGRGWFGLSCPTEPQVAGTRGRGVRPTL